MFNRPGDVNPARPAPPAAKKQGRTHRILP